ncbi:MAG: hypothetical protein ACPGNV_03025 [Mangrovicoccus sp.]
MSDTQMKTTPPRAIKRSCFEPKTQAKQKPRRESRFQPGFRASSKSPISAREIAISPTPNIQVLERSRLLAAGHYLNHLILRCFLNFTASKTYLFPWTHRKRLKFSNRILQEFPSFLHSEKTDFL